MVEFSSMYIIFEYLRICVSWIAGLVTGHGSVFAFGIIFLLSVLVSAWLRKDRAAGGWRHKVRSVSHVLRDVFGVIFFLTAFLTYRTSFEQWGLNTLGMVKGNLYPAMFIVVFSIVSLICIAGARFSPRTPNDDSTLNRRQKFQAILVLSAAAVIIAFLWRFAYEPFKALMIIVIFIMECISIIFWFYDPIIYILSKFVTLKVKPALPPTPGRLNRMAVLCCAHNEEMVIGHLVDSLYATTYPRNKYDIYVICDNCDDQTAQVAREHGGIVMERFDEKYRGKGHALKWMFSILQEKREQGEEYDAYIVLDADNLVNRQYLDEINRHLNEGYEIMQTYLGCKNPGDTWISKCYSMAYWLSNANYQAAHAQIGLSAQMGGTGMVFRPDVIEELEWEADSLTEDLVLTAKYVLKRNKSCYWLHNARLYDEKPTKYSTSIRQRTRWMQGHMDTMIHYAPKLFLSGLANGSFRQIDMGFYLLRPFLNLAMFFLYALRLISILFVPHSFLAIGFFMDFRTATILVLAYLLIQLYILDDESYLRYAVWIPLQYIFTYTWYIPILRGLMKYREKYWVATTHDRSLSIEDIHEDILMAEARRRLEGLDNLHRLPLGQIFLKAAIITKDQLEKALAIQKEKGGYLGNIVVEMELVSEETLNAYLSIQQTMRAEAEAAGGNFERMQIGEIMLDAGVITPTQLSQALAYQAVHGGYLGEALIQNKVMSPDMLNIFLEVQKLIDVNFISNDKAYNLISGVVNENDRKIGQILLAGGLISQPQLTVALEYQQTNGGRIGDILSDLGYISPNAIDIVLNVQKIGKQEKQGKQAKDQK